MTKQKAYIERRHIINEMDVSRDFEGLSCQAYHNSVFHVTITEEEEIENNKNFFSRVFLRIKFLTRTRLEY